MDSLLFAAAIAAILFLLGIWSVLRVRQMRRHAREREQLALRGLSVTTGGLRGASAPRTRVTDFASSEPLARGGIEVAEMSEVVDLEALLSSVPPRLAAQAREVLDEPTNIGAGAPPLPSLAPAQGARPPLQVQSAPMPQGNAASARRSPPPRPTLATLIAGASLRDLALTWYRARGYSSSPASPALRPIENVLRHRADAARAYAVVCEKRNVQAAQVDAWLQQARGVGLVRLLVIAEAGVEPAAEARKGVRILDRARMEVELQRLDPQVVARIIALVGARPRAAEPELVRS